MLKIALTVSTEGRDYYIRKRYTNVLLRCAAVAGVSVMPVILPLTEDEALIRAYAQEFDGFLFTGGDDVDPVRYGEEKLPACGTVEPERDACELALLREVTALGKPVFGICRGLQIMNVFCGGSLWQDIPTQYKEQYGGGREHCRKDESGATHHEIRAEGWMAEVAGAAQFSANSYHHQSVKVPGRALTVCAWSEDGTAEAFVHGTLPFFRAVQWHPEVDPDDVSQRLFEAFFDAVLNHR